MKGERPEILGYPELSCLISTNNNSKEKTKTHRREIEKNKVTVKINRNSDIMNMPTKAELTKDQAQPIITETERCGSGFYPSTFRNPNSRS